MPGTPKIRTAWVQGCQLLPGQVDGSSGGGGLQSAPGIPFCAFDKDTACSW